MRMLYKCMTQKAVADTLGYNPVTIWKWREAYGEEGEEGFHQKPVSGGPRKLGDREMKKLMFCLTKGATAYGFKNDV